MLFKDMEKYLSISQAAELLNVSSETLRRWDKNGKFKSSRHPINNYRVYSEEQVINLVEELQLEIQYRTTNRLSNNIQPYFVTSFGKLYNYDAIQYLKQLDSNSIDLIFADPPYNIKKAEWDTFANQKEYVDWSMEWISESYRVLKKPGPYIFVDFQKSSLISNGLHHIF